MERLKNKKSIIVLIILLFICLAFFFFYEAKFSIKKTGTPSGIVSIENSYYYINPQRALGNGIEKIRLTVMILNDQGIGIENKKLSIEGDKKLIIDSISPVSDQYGQSIFDISCNSKGIYEVNITADGQNLPQTAKLNFY